MDSYPFQKLINIATIIDNYVEQRNNNINMNKDVIFIRFESPSRDLWSRTLHRCKYAQRAIETDRSERNKRTVADTGHAVEWALWKKNEKRKKETKSGHVESFGSLWQ